MTYGRPSIEHAREIADKMIDLYSKAETDAVYIAVNEFKSAMAPNIVLRKVLPVEMPEGGGEQVDYIYEQPPSQLPLLFRRGPWAAMETRRRQTKL